MGIRSTMTAVDLASFQSGQFEICVPKVGNKGFVVAHFSQFCHSSFHCASNVFQGMRKELCYRTSDDGAGKLISSLISFQSQVKRIVQPNFSDKNYSFLWRLYKRQVKISIPQHNASWSFSLSLLIRTSFSSSIYHYQSQRFYHLLLPLA